MACALFLTAPAGAATSTGTGTSTSTSTATQIAPPPMPQSGQAGAQNQAGNTNNMASMLGKAAGILSMASGGLHIARGAQELACCMQGCKTGAGGVADADAARQAADTADKAGKLVPVKRQPIDYFKLRFPDEASCTPRSRFLLLELLRPIPARANGCVDGMIALATGGLMMLNGILGLAAANQAGEKGAAAMNNASGMSSISGNVEGGATSPTPDSPNNGGPGNAKLGGGGNALNTVKMDPALLRTGTANDIMGQFEKKFGIARESFADRVFNSEDPRNILTSAPINPIKVSDMNKAIAAAQQMSDGQKATALAGTQLEAAQRELAGGGAGVPPPAATAAKPLFDKDKEEELNPLPIAAAQPAIDDLSVSPEVKAALLERELEESKKLDVNMSIFQIVHRKYVEKTKMIFGYDPGAKLKGVGNADGY